MARVTVEDCLKNVKNRFELVIIAAKRARQLMRGKEAKVEWDNDKPTVVALREVAAGYVNPADYEHHEEEEIIQIQTVKIQPAATEDEADDELEEKIELDQSEEENQETEKYNRTDEE